MYRTFEVNKRDIDLGEIMSKKLCILICETFEREAQTVIQKENLKNVTVITYPTSMFHIRTGWEGVVNQIQSNKYVCQIILLGGGCIVGLGSRPKELDDCYYFQVAPPYKTTQSSG